MQVTPVNQMVRTESWQTLLNRVFGLFGAVNGGLDLTNMSAQIVNVTAPASPNTQFAVAHTLGRVPTFYLVISDRACRVYQLANTGTAWTSTNVYLKCDTASAVLQVLLI